VKIVECVPNFSEGRDRKVIDAITGAIAAVDGITLLDVDPGAGANRTVVTFVGAPEQVESAAFAAIARAAELIDMRKHAGSHARMGATDVCPFVPVSGVTVEECVEAARRLGRRVAEELSIPVYLYEEAATCAERRNLADIRAGEYEALPEKLAGGDFDPDFGEPTFNARSGATVIGVRKFLVAYNVNLDSDRKEDARDLALSLREKGRFKRDASGRKVPDGEGGFERVPGMLAKTKAVGWLVPEYGCAQVSMNLTDHEVTGMHDAFEATDELARSKGLRVTGSEVVGVVPLAAMLASGRHFLAKRGASRGVPTQVVIENAVRSLGLSEVAPFDPRERVLELRLADRPLVGMDLERFSAELSQDSPAPGGGSVSALAGALAAALVSMVANLTFGKGGEALRERMERAALDAQSLRERLLDAVDRDTEAFNEVMAALRMPRRSDEEKASRRRALESATRTATQVPLGVMELGVEAMELALLVVREGTPSSLSDAGVAGLMARSCVAGARLNVLINVGGIGDDREASRIEKRCDELMGQADETAKVIEDTLEEKLT
jgi:glutamate formiminotransferase/formiminotetrahydrofolate cyclodeaminase